MSRWRERLDQAGYRLVPVTHDEVRLTHRDAHQQGEGALGKVARDSDRRGRDAGLRRLHQAARHAAIRPSSFKAFTMSPIVYAVAPVLPVNVEPDTTAVPAPAVNPAVVPVVDGCTIGVEL